MPWFGLRCVIVVFPDHKYLLFVWILLKMILFVDQGLKQLKVDDKLTIIREYWR